MKGFSDLGSEPFLPIHRIAQVPPYAECPVEQEGPLVGIVASVRQIGAALDGGMQHASRQRKEGPQALAGA